MEKNWRQHHTDMLLLLFSPQMCSNWLSAAYLSTVQGDWGQEMILFSGAQSSIQLHLPNSSALNGLTHSIKPRGDSVYRVQDGGTSSLLFPEEAILLIWARSLFSFFKHLRKYFGTTPQSWLRSISLGYFLFAFLRKKYSSWMNHRR